MDTRSLCFRVGRALEVLGLLVPLAGLSYGMTAERAGSGLTIELLAIGFGLLLFYLGRNLVSRSLHP